MSPVREEGATNPEKVLRPLLFQEGIYGSERILAGVDFSTALTGTQKEKVRVMKARLAEGGKELAASVTIADTLAARLRGLLGRAGLPAGDGLLIRPCKGIHTFFMKFPIDAVFLDKENRIVALFRDLPPNRLTPIYRKASAVLELPAGTLDSSIEAGDHIDFF